MKSGRVLSTAVAIAALCGCAAIVIATGGQDRADRGAAAPAAQASASSASIYQPQAVPTTTAPRVTPKRTATRSRPASHAGTTRPAPSSNPPVLRPPVGIEPLPVAGATSNAQQAITVAAPAWGATRATLQAWNRSGAGWTKVGPSVSAWLGSAGMSTNAREGYSGTPAGSFGLTQAFGNYADPGTAMPYFQATADDWWDGDSTSATYNTHQRCAPSSCRFRTSESENLHDIGWVYGYAVVINYNMSPAVPGKGSAFFLHVTENKPTEGCVSIPQGDLVRILAWLDPARHPRILMGVG
jgi:L,D-peptidoglycan transpeptidase YkuD (ErfK/YbiS/YcfS/YnhG family)